jgi:cytochrome c oxidase cbb3-type subunit III
MSSRCRDLGVAAALALALLAPGCRAERTLDDRVVAPGAGERLAIPASTLRAGPGEARAPVVNPYDGNARALREGKRFYEWFNCAGCHGAIGGGAIGPPLRDGDWIYGGDPGQIYQSIVEGRPHGMPAYRGRIPEEALWKLIAYVAAFGGTEARPAPGAPIAEPEQARREAPHREDRHDEE